MPPLVSIVIPHFNGEEILERCLTSLASTAYANKEIIVVDNGSRDGSAEAAARRHPEICVIRNSENLGYAGGCHSGLRQAHGSYVVFLNNDTEVEPQWLSLLVAAGESDPRIAACQPKLLSIYDKSKFDYAGAAGGEMDIFGYPFCRGRIFFSCEKDQGQYDAGGDIFWASGAALFMRKSALEQVGGFDEKFFAHMEEIDLCWRLQLAGWRVVAVPQARVYHRAGATLRPDSYQKLFLNHRNNLVMILKNYQPKNLLWIVPLRIFFELITFCAALPRRDWVRAKAVLAALFFVITNAKRICQRRKAAQGCRQLPDREIILKMYRGSIVWAYFVRGIRRFQDLNP